MRAAELDYLCGLLVRETLVANDWLVVVITSACSPSRLIRVQTVHVSLCNHAPSPSSPIFFSHSEHPTVLRAGRLPTPSSTPQKHLVLICIWCWLLRFLRPETLRFFRGRRSREEPRTRQFAAHSVISQLRFPLSFNLKIHVDSGGGRILFIIRM